MSSTDLAGIKALLIADVERLARTLAPEGHRAGAYWIAKNPTRADRHAGSFWVALRPPCAWKDEATGEGGDLFGLIAYCEGHAEFRDTLRWARGFLHLEDQPAPERARRVAAADQARQRAEADAAHRAEKGRLWAHAVYLDARRQPWDGSPADRYLIGRGIDVRHLPKMPGCLGWVASHRHRETDTTWPAMVAAFTRADGKIGAVHRTFLTCEGGKAPVSPVRKIYPSFAGAAIRLHRGASGLDVKAAEAAGLLETLVLTEGVEDGLSVVLATPEHRVWAAGSLGNLAALVLPGCIDRVIVCADNDWGKPQARRQLDAACEALARQGARVDVARSHVGKDVNDALLAR